MNRIDKVRIQLAICLPPSPRPSAHLVVPIIGLWVGFFLPSMAAIISI